jgi:purine-cytosine permease-like protein
MRRIVWVVTAALVVLAVVAGAIALLWPALGRSIWSQVHAYRWWLPLLVVAAVLASAFHEAGAWGGPMTQGAL